MLNATDIPRYYRGVSDVLGSHLTGREVSIVGVDGRTARATGSAVRVAQAVAAGAGSFRIDVAGRIALRVIPGEGADIAAAATALLALAEAMTSDGLLPVPCTDGSAGLLLLARADGDTAGHAARYAAALAARSPELASLDRAQADGRSWIDPSPSVPGSTIPAPYSLVPSGGQWDAVIPLSLDDVAATTAGMPMELSAADVPARLAAHGDLAAALIRRTQASG